MQNKCTAWTQLPEIMMRDLLVVRPEFPVEESLRLTENQAVFHPLAAKQSRHFPIVRSVAALLQVIAPDHKVRSDMFEVFAFP